MKYQSLVRLTTAFAVLASFAVAKAETYALLIGINDYPDVLDASGNLAKDANGNPIDPDLKGCENDVKAMVALITTKYGVKTENVKTLLSKQATGEAFIENMKWLVNAPKAGDQVLFFFSGHGGQIKSDKEEDGLDEVIVLADNKLVPDDFFGELAPMFASAGVNATFVFDSCYSGGMARQGMRIKFQDLTKSTVHSLLSEEQLQSASLEPKTAEVQTEGVYAFLFAGQEGQPTIDISGLKDIPDHGLFTLFLTAAITDNPNATLQELVDIVANTINKELEFTQVPNMEASDAARADKPLIIRD